MNGFKEYIIILNHYFELNSYSSTILNSIAVILNTLNEIF